MTILSDTTLRERITKHEIVLDGNPLYANHCGYEFKPGRLVYGGTVDNRPREVDFSSSSPTASIPPSAVAWVRSKERVKIPHDMVGLWIQTNSLSRQGLLLLNMTLVEPGYEGHLSAHLVNLGTQLAVLGPQDTIAKLVLLKLDAKATELVKSDKYSNYDTFLDKLAMRSSASFLQITELIPNIKMEAEAALTKITDEARTRLKQFTDETTSGARQDLQDFTAKTIEESREKLRALEDKTFKRLGVGFVLGFVLAIIFSLWIFPFLRGVDAESNARIRQVVADENKELLERIASIQADLRKFDTSSRSPSPSMDAGPVSP